MKKIYLFLICTILLLSLSGCKQTFVPVAGISLSDLWEINLTSGFIEPIPIEFNRTVRVNDLVIANESSLKIGEGVIQSRISTNTLLDGSFNRTILVTDRDTLTEANFEGTLYTAVFNLNNSIDSGSSISAFNNNEDALHLMKLSVAGGGDAFIINENNNLNIITINGTVIEFGVYQNLTETVSLSPLRTIEDVNQESVEFSIEDNLIKLNTFTNVEQNLFFRHLDSGIPDNKTGFVAMYCKDNNRCYIKQDTGQERRLVDAGGGSIVLNEVIKINNHTEFYGNVYFNNTVFNGGVGYACIDALGRLFKSTDPCHTTSDTFVNGNISDPTMGDNP